MNDLVLVNFGTPAFKPLGSDEMERLSPSKSMTLQLVPYTFETYSPEKIDVSRMREWHFKIEDVVIGQLVGTLQTSSRLYINMFQIHPDLMFKGFGKVCISLFLKSNPQFSVLCGVSTHDDEFSAVDFWTRCGATFKRCCCCQRQTCDSICLDDGCHFYLSNPALPK